MKTKLTHEMGAQEKIHYQMLKLVRGSESQKQDRIGRIG